MGRIGPVFIFLIFGVFLPMQVYSDDIELRLRSASIVYLADDGQIEEVLLSLVNISDHKQWIVKPELLLSKGVSIYDSSGMLLKGSTYTLRDVFFSNYSDKDLFLELSPKESYQFKVLVRKVIVDKQAFVALSSLGISYELPATGIRLQIRYSINEYVRSVFAKEYIDEYLCDVNLITEVFLLTTH
jgi:hypothetical protein